MLAFLCDTEQLGQYTSSSQNTLLIQQFIENIMKPVLFHYDSPERKINDEKKKRFSCTRLFSPNQCRNNGKKLNM